MRIIDADALKKHYAWWEDERQKLFDSIVDQQPTVDAVPVIRCKDCKYAMKQYITNLPWLTQWEYSCRYYNTHSVMGDDWCSRAEREEE